jgi:hypothetical protein
MEPCIFLPSLSRSCRARYDSSASIGPRAEGQSMSQCLAPWLCHPPDSVVPLHRFVNFTRHIDRLNNALPVAPSSPVFTIRPSFSRSWIAWSILRRMPCPHFVDFHSSDRSFLSAAFFSLGSSGIFSSLVHTQCTRGGKAGVNVGKMIAIALN